MLAAGGLGDAKINDLRASRPTGLADGDENIGRFDIAMDDPLLMRVLDGLTDLREKLQPFFGAKIALVAVVGDFDAPHQFHDEIRPAGGERRRFVAQTSSLLYRRASSL